ncbi:delta(24)-sterol reductase isoform X2 [Folsomia candida]|nr:delta(24)-sterol reductase isoform X2 [Folsomia candida]XP_035708172.1 delta(24)-sterol reductase isoform X2 [Folsomia candida]
MVTADGDIVNCSKTENSDLFNAMPCSYGTIGFLTAVTMPLILAGKYIKIEYVHMTSVPAAIKLMRERNKNHGYVEGIMYSMTDIMLMFGDTTDNPKKSQINYINRWYKPFFHNMVENIMKKLKASKKKGSSSPPYVEYFPLRDYFHRHSRGMFWQAENNMPLLSNRIVMFFFGWMHPINTQLVLGLTPSFLLKFMIKDKVLQDFCVPMEKLDEFLRKLDTIFKLYPIWWCPTKISNDSMWKTPQIYNADYMNLGIYGTAIPSGRTIAERIGECEQYCLHNDGYNGFYGDVFLNREELRKMYDTTAYDKVRKASSSCRKAFPDVFDKVLRKIK